MSDDVQELLRHGAGPTPSMPDVDLVWRSGQRLRRRGIWMRVLGIATAVVVIAGGVVVATQASNEGDDRVAVGAAVTYRNDALGISARIPRDWHLAPAPVSNATTELLAAATFPLDPPIRFDMSCLNRMPQDVLDHLGATDAFIWVVRVDDAVPLTANRPTHFDATSGADWPCPGVLPPGVRGRLIQFSYRGANYYAAVVVGADATSREHEAFQILDSLELTAPPGSRVAFTYPHDCTSAYVGRQGVVRMDPLADNPTPSWTTSPAGQWLQGRLAVAGNHDPYPVGSAFVTLHGVDGVVYVWFGPPDDTGGLTLQTVDGVDTAEISPSRPFDDAPYRPSIVDSIVAGGVRIWMLTHARGAYEARNFPGLTSAPCLPDQQTLRRNLKRIATAADQQPHRGRLPATAGRFAVNSDAGITHEDPGDVHLLDVGSKAVPELRLVPPVALDAAGTIWVWSEIPPGETDPNDLAETSNDQTLVRTSAGGLDVRIRLLSPLDTTIIDQLRAIAAALNREPFLGQANAT